MIKNKMRCRDQMGRALEFNFPPQRIVSLVPSQSELLWDLGLQEALVGITKFCIHPEEMFTTKKRIGGTKKLNMEAIRALQPDLIIGNKEENEQQDILALEKEFPVWMSDIFTLQDAMEMISELGKLTNRVGEAELMVETISQNWSNLKSSSLPLKVAYVIWEDPMMVAASNTFIDFVISRLGWVNVFAKEDRYVSIHDFSAVSPDVVLLSSEPFPFKEKHLQLYRERFPNAHIQLVDGEMFSWYGSRLMQAPAYFEQLIQEVKESLPFSSEGI